MSCRDCFSGHVHPGTATGSETTLHGLPAYVAEPPEGTPVKGLIVVVPDAYGWKIVNTRTLADAYAKRTGCRVYVVEFMDGMYPCYSRDGEEGRYRWNEGGGVGTGSKGTREK